MKDFSYTEFTEENEKDPCQIVSIWGEKVMGSILNYLLFLFLTVINMLTEKNTITQINSLSNAEFFQGNEMHPCQALTLGKQFMRLNVKQ